MTSQYLVCHWWPGGDLWETAASYSDRDVDIHRDDQFLAQIKYLRECPHVDVIYRGRDHLHTCIGNIDQPGIHRYTADGSILTISIDRVKLKL